MAQPPRVDSPEEVGARLRLLRLAYGAAQHHSREMSQSEIARKAGVSVQTWNNAETGDYRLGLDSALKIATAIGVSLDFIYRNERGMLPHALALEIDKLEAQKVKKQRA